MSVCKPICQDGKQTSIQSQDLQVWIKPANASEFLICIQNKSHLILGMIQQTYIVFFVSLNVYHNSYS